MESLTARLNFVGDDISISIKAGETLLFSRTFEALNWLESWDFVLMDLWAWLIDEQVITDPEVAHKAALIVQTNHDKAGALVRLFHLIDGTTTDLGDSEAVTL